MKKIIVSVALILILVIAVFFYFGLHTYFIENKVSEEAPEMVGAVSDMADVSVGTQEDQKVFSGSFVPVDAIHKGSGEARILPTSDGLHILRFEDNFKVTNGPDLYVYLSNAEQPGGTESSLGEYINLGLLKGNVGSQNYVIPAGYEDYKTAVIWCKKYGVLFSYVLLK